MEVYVSQALKYLQWRTLQHRRQIARLCMLYKKHLTMKQKLLFRPMSSNRHFHPLKFTPLQQEGILSGHVSIWSIKVSQLCYSGIFCGMFTFTTSICSLFSGAEWHILGGTFNNRVLSGIQIFLQWKWVYCSLAVALERTVFPFVKQYIKDKMAADCCYDPTSCTHVLSSGKRSVQ